MTSVVIASIIVITCTVPSMCASLLTHPPENISQNRGDCLHNQYFIFSNFTCGNCTYCHHGTEHFPHTKCGNGYGVRATCRPCPEGFYQTEKGYSALRCRRCVRCDEKAEVLQQCSPTKNAECGACPPGTYAFTPNLCLNCTQDPTNSACARPTPMRAALTDESASEVPSMISLPASPPLPVSTSLPATTLLPSQLSSQAQNTSISYGEPTTKFSFYGVMIAVVVTVILSCVILLVWCGYQRWKTQHNSGSGNPQPGKQQPTSFQNASYTNLPIGDNVDILTTTSGQESTLPSQVDETGRTPEESIALIGEPRGHATTTHETEILRGAGVPVRQPVTLPLALPSNELSVPGELSSNGGPGGDAVYQHQWNNEPRSSDSAKDNSVAEEDDDDDTLSHPGPLMS